MAFGRRKKKENQEIKEALSVLGNKLEEVSKNVVDTEKELKTQLGIKTKDTEEKINFIKKPSIRKGSKIIVNGRCFGSEKLECPLKTVRNYETKILEVSDKSVLIDEGWISKDNIK